MSTSSSNSGTSQKSKTDPVGIGLTIQHRMNYAHELDQLGENLWGLEYLKQGLHLSRHLENKPLEYRLLTNKLILTNFKLGKPEDAMKVLEFYLSNVNDLNDIIGNDPMTYRLFQLEIEKSYFYDEIQCAKQLFQYSDKVNNSIVQFYAKQYIYKLGKISNEPSNAMDFCNLGIVSQNSLEESNTKIDIDPVKMIVLKDSPDVRNLCNERHKRGEQFLQEKKYDEAMKCFVENVEVSKKLWENKLIHAESLFVLGVCMVRMVRFEGGSNCLIRALNISLILNEYSLVSKCLSCLKQNHNGYARKLRKFITKAEEDVNMENHPIPNDFDRAIQSLKEKAANQDQLSKNYEKLEAKVTIIRSETDKCKKFTNSMELGNMFYDLEKFVEAEHQYNNAYAIYRELNSPYEKFEIYLKMAENYCQLNKIDAACGILQKFLYLSNPEFNSKDIISAYEHLCEIYFEHKIYTEAIQHAKILESLCKGSEKLEYAGKIRNDSTNVLYGDAMEKRLQNAGKLISYNETNVNDLRNHYENQFQKARQACDKDLKISSLINIAKIDLYLGKYKSAVFHYKEVFDHVWNRPEVSREIQLGLAKAYYSMKIEGRELASSEIYFGKLNLPSADLDCCYIYWVLSYLFLKANLFEDSMTYAKLHYDLAKKLTDKSGISVAFENMAYVKKTKNIVVFKGTHLKK